MTTAERTGVASIFDYIDTVSDRVSNPGNLTQDTLHALITGRARQEGVPDESVLARTFVDVAGIYPGAAAGSVKRKELTVAFNSLMSELSQVCATNPAALLNPDLRAVVKALQALDDVGDNDATARAVSGVTFAAPPPRDANPFRQFAL